IANVFAVDIHPAAR
nr:RecName: Full=Probable serine acetyltransferase [Pseudotsuga menziesii]